MTHRAAALPALILLAACQAIPPATQPVPPPPPAPAPTPTPPPPVAAPAVSWEEAAVEPGDWRHELTAGASTARFGAAVTLRCDLATRQIALTVADRPGVTTATIRTTFGTLNWQGQAQGNALVIARPASDIGFDWMSFSRGRIAIETPGAPRLVLPVWAEISRVVEDCRN